jgi:hypothetical protein
MSDNYRTRIDTISQVGDELDEEQLRLASGGDKVTDQIFIEGAGGCYLRILFCGERNDGFFSNDPNL